MDTGSPSLGGHELVLERDHFPGKRRMVLDRIMYPDGCICKNARRKYPIKNGNCSWAVIGKAGWYGLLSMGVGALITNVCLKNLVARTRPYEVVEGLVPLIRKPTDYSFPSGHTCASFACTLVLYRILPKKYGVPAVLLAALIAFSRLYVGVHYPTDVLGGLAVGIFSSCLVLWIGKKRTKK